MLYSLLLIIGFVVLVYGANLLVDSASALAGKYNVPNIVIGLTIVAFGTSSPELIVNLFASIDHNSALALGNVVGSSIFNILGTLGLCSIICPLAVKNNTTWLEIPLALLSAIVVLVLANDTIIDGENESLISRLDGIILLAFFLIFLVYNFQLARQGLQGEEIPVKNYSVPKSILLIFAGLALLVAGGRAIVFSAVEIAQFFGISERIIGLTIVSIGTSLPELATSVVATRKKNVDIAIGNIVGSNIFNMFFILGTSAVVYPVALQEESNTDLLVNIFASLALFIFLFTGKGRKLERLEGIVLLVAYIAYVAMLILN